MKVRIPKKLAALVGVGAVAAATTGCGADGSGQATAAGNQIQAPQGQQQQGGQQQGGPGMLDTAALAKKLGVSESKLKAALKAVMPQGGPPNGTPPSGAAPQQGSGSAPGATS
jgi:hypothetical protein